ncbi:hypothetical protein [Halostella pelagica]|uniref:hypothetical protein n=1 Tax=Halostella pelagica TaxID=2583824 RepID=UPI001081AA5F|nr:hypothetical protein [Halostella pelagica]
MPTADASDVRIEINTYLDDATIEGADDDPDDDGILGRIERDIEREEEMPGMETADRRDLEAVLAAHHIATTHDRAESQSQTGRTSVTYEESLIDELKGRAKRLGATDELLGIGGAKPTASISVPSTKGTKR